jgi:hypothetical protein
MRALANRLRVRLRAADTAEKDDVAAAPEDGAATLERQAVSPEQFDRPPVYLLGRA